ncbi:MAG: SMC-Scp complex subunit ScpB [Planctomycetes bacterium]|nr:SMC-Scp complex subunit ScpB [Planctomycetota bacterium]
MTEKETRDPKRAIEAVLFSVGKKIPTHEIARIVGCSENSTLKHLSALVEEYRSRDSPLLILSEGSAWKMTVREKYLPVVQALIPETDMTKGVLETLAVVAWKAPACLQTPRWLNVNRRSLWLDYSDRLFLVISNTSTPSGGRNSKCDSSNSGLILNLLKVTVRALSPDSFSMRI